MTSYSPHAWGWTELSAVLWNRISDQFRAFVGMTAFEDLCREWVLVKARAAKLPLIPEVVGSHWSMQAQVDVVAINWRDKTILLGEANGEWTRSDNR